MPGGSAFIVHHYNKSWQFMHSCTASQAYLGAEWTIPWLEAFVYVIGMHAHIVHSDVLSENFMLTDIDNN